MKSITLFLLVVILFACNNKEDERNKLMSSFLQKQKEVNASLIELRTQISTQISTQQSKDLGNPNFSTTDSIWIKSQDSITSLVKKRKLIEIDSAKVQYSIDSLSKMK